MTIRPFGVHSGVAVLVLIFAILMAASIVPFTPLVVGVLIAGLCCAAFF